MPTLTPGQNLQIAAAPCEITINSGAPADFSAFLLHDDGRTRIDGDFVFYGQTASPDGAVRLTFEGRKAGFTINLPALAAEIKRIVLAVTSDFPTVSSLASLNLTLTQAGQSALDCKVDLNRREEAALILGEIYRHGGGWKFRFVDQGYNGGLTPLAESFGVEIAEDAQPAQARNPEPAPRVNLSKITLTKEKPAVDLKKHDLKKGVYRVNLNWSQGQPRGGLGRFFGGNKGVDLDLAAYVRLTNGDQTIVQALGNTFGSLERPPYVRLLGDDRTGAVAEGEWLEINGEQLDQIREIIIYTFIYEGAPNWGATDAKVRLEITGLPEVETALTEGDNSKPMCAIARIINDGGQLRIERLNRYYPGHRQMDRDFGWGFNWQRGSKD